MLVCYALGVGGIFVGRGVLLVLGGLKVLLAFLA